MFPKFLAEFAALSETAHSSEVKPDSGGQTTMKMSAEQMSEYKQYRKASRFAGVWPTRADFIAGDITSCVKREMEWMKQQNQPQLAMVAGGAR
jgi:hypothetical protein